MGKGAVTGSGKKTIKKVADQSITKFKSYRKGGTKTINGKKWKVTSIKLHGDRSATISLKSGSRTTTVKESFL